jgi:hypothetical protein
MRAHPMKPATLVPPRLRVTRLDDYEKIRQLALAHSLDFPSAYDWRSLWLENPLVQRTEKDWPIGWVLETTSGEIVGNFGIVPSVYTFRGRNLVSTAGRFWFATSAYRGFALQLMDEYLNQTGVDLFINNAVSTPAFETFSRLLKPIPLGEWESMSYFEIGSRDMPLKIPVPHVCVSFTVEAIDKFDSRFDVFWDELRRQNSEKLLAERSSQALSWHFAIPIRKGRLWIFAASRNGQLRAFCTLTKQDRPFSLPPLPYGDAHGPKVMRLVDYQSINTDADLLPLLLAAALDRCAKESIDILENFGRGVPKMRFLDESAPRRKELSNWKFFFTAADSRLLEELREPLFWDPSAFDGEASFE